MFVNIEMNNAAYDAVEDMPCGDMRTKFINRCKFRCVCWSESGGTSTISDINETSHVDEAIDYARNEWNYTLRLEDFEAVARIFKDAVDGPALRARLKENMS